MALKTKSTKVKFGGDKSAKSTESIASNGSATKSKHIIFDDEDDDNKVVERPEKQQDATEKKQDVTEKKQKVSKKNEKNRKDAMDIGTLWYQTVGFNQFIIE